MASKSSETSRSVAELYAEALLGAATEAGVVERVADELNAFIAAVAKDAKLRAFVETPTVPALEKRAVLAKGIPSFHAVTLNFLSVVMERGRVRGLAQIAVMLRELRNVKASISEVKVQSAVALDNSQREKLKKVLKAQLKTEITLHEEVRPGLLGGLVVSSGDLRWDSSLSERLKKLSVKLAIPQVGASLFKE